jgi:hypothetical protein
LQRWRRDVSTAAAAVPDMVIRAAPTDTVATTTATEVPILIVDIEVGIRLREVMGIHTPSEIGMKYELTTIARYPPSMETHT